MTPYLAKRSLPARRPLNLFQFAVVLAACVAMPSPVIAQAAGGTQDGTRAARAAQVLLADDGQMKESTSASPATKPTQTVAKAAPAPAPPSSDADPQAGASAPASGTDPQAAPAAQKPAAPPPPPPVEIHAVETRWRTYDLEGHPEYGYHLYNPYNQNPIKGDFPIGESNWFVEADVLSTSVYKSRRNIDFSKAFAPEIAAGKLSFFEHNNFLNQNGIFGLEFRHNDDRFVPANFDIRVDGVADLKHDINAFNATTDSSGTVFDAFFDLKVHDFGKDNFDLMFVRGGIQFFKSDFHGLIFNDEGLGGRIDGSFKKNRFRYDAVALKLFQKDAVSGFIDFTKPSAHDVVILRFTAEDFLVKGWNSEWSFHYNHDPRKIAGGPATLDLDTFYYGATFNGHIGRVIFNPAIYGVSGHADHLVLGAPVQHSVGAFEGVVDIEYPVDYWRLRAGYVYQSGDSNPAGKHDGGFDSISDAVTLFGGPISYFIGQNIKFGNGDFIRGNSIYASLRGANNQSNYVNPGLQIANAGFDTIFTRRVQMALNLNYYHFNELGTFPNNNKFKVPVVIGHNDAGVEENIFVRFKPFLRQANDLFLIDTGFSVMQPGQGMKDAFGSSRPVYSTFLAVRLVY